MTTRTPSTTLTLTVTEAGLPEAPNGYSTVLIFSGLDPETGENYFFAVDHRPANDLIAVVCDEGEVEVAVESWQIIGKGAF